MYEEQKVVVVMPAYNAARTIRQTYDETMAQGVVDLVVVVDDASDDETIEIARSLPAQPHRNGGFVVTLVLLIVVMMGLVLVLAWRQGRAAAVQQAEQRLQIRLKRELARELERLDSGVAAAPGRPTSRPPRQALLMQALHNLLRRGRSEQLILEKRRRQLQRLLRNSVGGRLQEVRGELRKLDPEVVSARAWVDALQARIRIQEARGLRAPPFSPSASADSLAAEAPEERIPSPIP